LEGCKKRAESLENPFSMYSARVGRPDFLEDSVFVNTDVAHQLGINAGEHVCGQIHLMTQPSVNTATTKAHATGISLKGAKAGNS
jgi:hypothetical protein